MRHMSRTARKRAATVARRRIATGWRSEASRARHRHLADRDGAEAALCARDEPERRLVDDDAVEEADRATALAGAVGVAAHRDEPAGRLQLAPLARVLRALRPLGERHAVADEHLCHPHYIT